MNFSSKLIENAVNEIAHLPGIGKKTALRLVLYLLKQDEDFTKDLSDSLLRLRNEIKYCSICHNISDHDICDICKNPKREKSVLCVVENIQDVMAIENTAQYSGQYHVLGGIISPLQGIGPSELKIDSLVSRIQYQNIKELIFALSATMEGDTTTHYISHKLKEIPLKISAIARGIPVGSELEYTDEITLGRSIVTRTLYE